MEKKKIIFYFTVLMNELKFIFNVNIFFIIIHRLFIYYYYYYLPANDRLNLMNDWRNWFLTIPNNRRPIKPKKNLLQCQQFWSKNFLFSMFQIKLFINHSIGNCIFIIIYQQNQINQDDWHTNHKTDASKKNLILLIRIFQH